MVKIKKILNKKEWYNILSWIYIKQNKKVPEEINDILDLITYIEEKEKKCQ